MIELQQASRAAPRRCPWCHDEGDPTGRGWVVCGRDRTPVHAACVAEFRICPICRVGLDAKDATPVPVIPPLATTARAGTIVVRPRIGGRRFGVEHLPGDVLELLATIRREHRARVLPTLFELSMNALAAAFFSLTGLSVLPWTWALALFIAIFAALTIALCVRRRFAPPSADTFASRRAAPDVRALAEELAANDIAALGHELAHGAAATEAARAEEELATLESRERADMWREELARRTPISDAQRIHGIGPGITGWLEAAGISSLQDLAATDPRTVKGIKEKRAALLEEWTRDRREGIDRLVASGDFPEREELDRRIDARLAEAERTGREAGERAVAARAALIELASKRPLLRRSLNPGNPGVDR